MYIRVHIYVYTCVYNISITVVLVSEMFSQCLQRLCTLCITSFYCTAFFTSFVLFYLCLSVFTSKEQEWGNVNSSVNILFSVVVGY